MDWWYGVAARLRVAATTVMSSWSGQGVAAMAAAEVAAMVAAEAAATIVGLLPQPSVTSHSRGRKFISFLQMTNRVCGGGGGVPTPLIEPKMSREGKGPT